LFAMQTPENVRRFYQSKQWKSVRMHIRMKKRGICEECGQAGWEVHHIIPLTAENVNDPSISIGEANLQLLCTSCHDAKRATDGSTRDDVAFDDNGELIHLNKRVVFNGTVYSGDKLAIDIHPSKSIPPRSKSQI